jgi:aminopeptidase-like protein
VDSGTLIEKISLEDSVHEMIQLMAELYPICRSITGDGLRQTLRILQDHIPFKIYEVPTGTVVFDWTIPKEWNIRDAYVRNSQGERVIDFRKSNLHVVGYSSPVHTTMSLAELREHLHSLPEQPDWIPYRTSYYRESWGFCLPDRNLKDLVEDTYEVCIDSTLEEGHLTYGEFYVEGEVSDEVLLSCHACHPSLCNDNLSGIVLATQLGKWIGTIKPRYSYRILFIPGTIGAIAWLALNEDRIGNIKHGLVLTCLGDSGPLTYKKSRRGDAEVDSVCQYVLRQSGRNYKVVEFSPYGYDERQYCSPGFDLPVGCLQRTPHGQYPEYHTSADNLELVSPESLGDSLQQYLRVLTILENNRVYLNTKPKCEPQLGKRGLYTSVGGKSDTFIIQMALLWVLNLSDGHHSLLNIAERSGLEFELICKAAMSLAHHGLLQEIA